MRVRLPAVLVIGAVELLRLAAGYGTASGVSLQTAESAFSRADVRFDSAWYSGRPPGIQLFTGPQAATLHALFGHVRGGVTSLNVAPPSLRSVYVMDTPGAAQSLGSAIRATPGRISGIVVLVAKNVVYVGKPSAGVRRALRLVVGPS